MCWECDREVFQRAVARGLKCSTAEGHRADCAGHQVRVTVGPQGVTGKVRTLPKTKKAEQNSLAMDFRRVAKRHGCGGSGGGQGFR